MVGRFVTALLSVRAQIAVIFFEACLEDANCLISNALKNIYNNMTAILARVAPRALRNRTTIIAHC